MIITLACTNIYTRYLNFIKLNYHIFRRKFLDILQNKDYNEFKKKIKLPSYKDILRNVYYGRLIKFLSK